MREQLERDEQTVTIASTVVLFILVLMLGGVVALFVERVTNPSAGVAWFLSTAMIAAAAGTSLRCLIRRRRP